MLKLFNKQNLLNVILSYSMSILLYQIIFINFDILDYLTSNSSGSFLGRPWIVLYFFTIIIFVVLIKFGRGLKFKNYLLIFVLLLLGINFSKFTSLGVVNYILSYEPIWKILIFSFSFVYLISIDEVKKIINLKKINLILNILIGLAILLYFFIPIMNHLNYRESGLDMGIYGQAIWKYAHFKYPANTLDHYWGIKNILGDHFEIILALISPIFWLSGSLIILHIFNGLVICLGSYFLYLLGKLKFKNNEILSKMVVLVFLAFTGLQMAFMEGQFHPLSYVPVLIIMMVYFIEIRKWWAYFVSLFVLLTIKESMGLYTFFIGIYIFLFHRKYWKIALLSCGIGVIHYLLTVREVGILFGSKYLYFNYGRLGETNSQVIKTIITNPIYALYVLLNPIGKIVTLSLILGSFGFLVFSSPLVLGIPMLAERFFSNDEHIWQFYMHYNTPLAGVLICSLIFFIYQNYFSEQKTAINKYISGKISVYALMIFVLISTSLININYRSDIVHLFNKFKENGFIDNNSKDLNEAVKIVPKDASVSTQNAIVTHFTARDQIYQFPVNLNAQYIVASSKKDYWLLDDAGFKDFLNNAVSNGYGIRFIKNHAIVLQKNYTGELSEIPASFFIQNR